MLNRQHHWPAFITHHAPHDVFLGVLTEDHQPWLVHFRGDPGPSVCFVQLGRMAVVAVPLYAAIGCFSASGVTYRGDVGVTIDCIEAAFRADPDNEGRGPSTLDADQEYPVVVSLDAAVKLDATMDEIEREHRPTDKSLN